MKITRLLIVAASTVAVCSCAADGNNETNWTTLFNGRDLTGWKQMNNGTFFATNGVIHLEGGQGWLRTEKEYSDFILEAEWRGLATNYNSGIYIRAPLDGNPWATNVWQVNLKQSAIGEVLAGARKAVLSTTTKPVGEWVKYRVEARGKKLTLFVNGERAWEFNEFEATRGYIGLQAEGKAVEFRVLRIQELLAEGQSKE
jgi:Domain of Unknown Function (DUF1080)